MSPEIYEQYIYQKGVREQLRESITNSSFITTIDKKLNITSNYAQKTGEIVSLKMSDIKKICFTLDKTLKKINLIGVKKLSINLNGKMIKKLII